MNNPNEPREGTVSELNRHFEQALFILAHNLNSPVSNIKSLAMIAQEPFLNGEDLKKCLKGIERSVSAIEAIVKDVTNIVIVTKGEVQKENVFFSDVVNSIHEQMRELFERTKANIETDFTMIESIDTVKPYLQSIFQNLLLNSLKYSRAEIPPVIRISSKKIDKIIVLTYKDNGIGIDLKKFGKDVFGLYKRFHANIEGRGIGLFMVKNQVELLGGSIGVNSAIGEGTEFIITFPID